MYALFGDKNENIKYTNCPISTHPAKKKHSCMLRMPMFNKAAAIVLNRISSLHIV